MNDGNDLNEPATKVSEYTDNAMTFTLLQSAHSATMISGKVYKFVYRAINSVGNSLDSDVVRFALCDMPAAPTQPSKVKSLSSLSSIYLQWP